MSAPAAAARKPRPVARVERWVEAEAGRHHGQAEQRQPASAEPAPSALAPAVAGTGVRVVPLRVGHAVVEHGVRQPHAADPVDARAHGVRRILAPASPVLEEVEGLAAVLALSALHPFVLPPLPATGRAREEGARLGRDHRGEALMIGAAVALAG